MSLSLFGKGSILDAIGGLISRGAHDVGNFFEGNPAPQSSNPVNTNGSMPGTMQAPQVQSAQAPAPVAPPPAPDLVTPIAPTYHNPKIAAAALALRQGKLSKENFVDYINSLGPANDWQDNLPNTPLLDAAHGLGTAAVNTAKLPVDAVNTLVQGVGGSTQAAENAAQATKNALDTSFFGGLARYPEDAIGAAAQPAAISSAQHAEDYANRVLDKSYNVNPTTGVYNPKGNAIDVNKKSGYTMGGPDQAAVEAGQAKLDLLKSAEANSGVDYNDTLKNDYLKAVPSAASGIAQALLFGLGGGESKALEQSLFEMGIKSGLTPEEAVALSSSGPGVGRVENAVTGATLMGGSAGANDLSKGVTNPGKIGLDISSNALPGLVIPTAEEGLNIGVKGLTDHTPLNESGAIPVDGELGSPEENIHKSNPSAPPETPTSEPLPEPTLSQQEIRQNEESAANLAQEKPQIDQAKVAGAGKALDQALKDKTDTLRSMDASAKGEQLIDDGEGGKTRITEHTPFYSDYYAENGHAPRVADYKAEAERQLTSGKDAEALNYQDLQRHAAAEEELTAYEKANKQSGYDKVKVKNTQTGKAPKGLPPAVWEKISSPEFEAKSGVWNLLKRIKMELYGSEGKGGGLQDTLRAVEKTRKLLADKGDINGIRALDEKTADLRFRYNKLINDEKAQSGEYGRAKQELDAKYPETPLYQDGKAPRGGNVTVSDQPVKADGAVHVTDSTATPTPEDNMTNSELLTQILGHKPGGEIYTGPNLNEGAFSPEDIAKLEQNGIDRDEQGNLTYSPERDMFINDTPQAEPRNLAGDTAAFEAVQAGKTQEEIIKAYQDATGADVETAARAVNLVEETGQGMEGLRNVQERNPKFENVNDTEPTDVKGVSRKAASYGKVAAIQMDNIDKEAAKLSPEDVMKLDKARGLTNEEAIAQNHPDDPEQYSKVLDAMRERGDINHEIRRLNGDATIYRTNHIAGIHTTVPEDGATIGGYRDTLNSTPGWSHQRNFSDYDYLKQELGLDRANPNAIEDLRQDTRSAVGYSRQRSIVRSLGDKVSSFGEKDSIRSQQLNGADNVFTTPEIAKEWNKMHPETTDRNLGLKGYDAAVSGVNQLIVLNPLFHTMNETMQAYLASGDIDGRVPGLGGTAEFMKSLAVGSDEARAQAIRYYEAGGDSASFGKDRGGFISKATRGVSDVNKKFLAATELKYRSALFDALTKNGMEDAKAIDTIDHFMGSPEAMDAAVNRMTLFLRYKGRMIASMANQVAHPIENLGANVNTAAAIGAIYGLNYAWQKFTGNPNAHVRAPGELGTAEQLISAGKNLVERHYQKVTADAANLIHPLVKEGIEQAANRDLYTGQNLTDTGRLAHARDTLIAPAGVAGDIASGKKSGAEVGLNELGLYTPHVKGAPAAPSGRVNIINTQGAKPAQGNDPTGVQQQTAYFDSTAKARNSLDPKDQKQYDGILAGETDANGQPVGSDDKQAQAKNLFLADNPKILAAITQQKRDYATASGTPLDPLYDPKYDSIRDTYLRQQGSPYKGDDYTQIGSANTDELKQLEADRNAYFAGQDFSGAPPSMRVQPPQFDDTVQAELAQEQTLSGTDKVTYINAHPDLQKAFDQIAQYTNDKRVAQGYAPFKLYPQADIATQAALNTFFALPKGDGPKGGNASEAKWIKANPDQYNLVQNYLANVSEYELANSAGADKYQGATPSQQELKSAYNLGNYDIVKNKGGTFSIDPQAASAANNAATGASFSSSKQAAQNRATGRYFRREMKFHEKSQPTAGKNRRVLLRVHNKPTKTVRIKGAKTGSLRITANKATL